MNTIKNIQEGFFSNIGNEKAANKELLINYLENLKKPKVVNDSINYVLRIERAIIKTKDKECENFFDVFNTGHILEMYISPDTIDPDATEIPEYLKAKPINTAYNYKYVSIKIVNMPKLKDLSALRFFADNHIKISSFRLINCPNVKNDQLKYLPSNYDGVFTWKPDPNEFMTFREISKYIKSADSIDINHPSKDYDSKLKSLKSKLHPATASSTAAPRISSSAVDGVSTAPKQRLKLIPVSRPEDAPTFKVNDRNKVFDQNDVEIGRLSRDMSTVYRDVNKILFVDRKKDGKVGEGEEIGLAFNKREQIIAKLVWGKV